MRNYKNMKNLFHLVLVTVVSMVLVSCGVYDKPPSLKTPEPPPHDGVFVSGKDTLWMNGDGKTIRWHFEKALPEIGKSGRGEYVFIFFNGKYRYDAAEYFRIIDTAHGNAHHQFGLMGTATPEGFTIARDDQNYQKQHFQKVKEN